MSKRLTLVVLLIGFLGGWIVSDLSNGVVSAQDKKEEAKSRDPKWLHAMDLRARKAGDFEWKDAKKFGIEVFRDENTGNLIYITETGSIAVVAGK